MCIYLYCVANGGRLIKDFAFLLVLLKGAIRRCLGGGQSQNVFGRARGMKCFLLIFITVSVSGLQSFVCLFDFQKKNNEGMEKCKLEKCFFFFCSN